MPTPQRDQLLRALPPSDQERVFPHLKLVTLPLGSVLYESGDTQRHIYFPVDCIISLLYVLKDAQASSSTAEARSRWWIAHNCRTWPASATRSYAPKPNVCCPTSRPLNECAAAFGGAQKWPATPR